MASLTNYSALRAHCVDEKDTLLIDALEGGMTVYQAAEQAGIAERTATSRLQKMRMRAAKDGVQAAVPEGHIVKGVSSLVDCHGNTVMQWVKTREDAELMARLMDEAKRAFSDTLPRSKAVKPSLKKKAEDLLNLYIVTDYHIGMNAWGEQTGEPWDVEIAEQLLIDWFKYAIQAAPDAKVGVLGQLGDFLHWDNVLPLTNASKNVLDADTRFQKLVRIAIRVTRHIVSLLLKKHEQVHIIMAEGNHDEATSMWLREMCQAFYENEPRVSVDTNPDPYYCYEFGDTSLFFHHGHRKRQRDIDTVFVAKFREVFGRTKFSYGHMGHLHHDKVLETYLMHVVQHRTLAAPDAYASNHGYMSSRGAPVITYHNRHGKVQEAEITPAMVS